MAGTEAFDVNGKSITIGSVVNIPFTITTIDFSIAINGIPAIGGFSKWLQPNGAPAAIIVFANIVQIDK